MKTEKERGRKKERENPQWMAEREVLSQFRQNERKYRKTMENEKGGGREEMYCRFSIVSHPQKETLMAYNLLADR